MNNKDHYMKFFRGFYALFLISGLGAVFLFFWYNKLNLLMNDSFNGKGNYLVFVVYIIIFVTFSRSFNGYKLGILRLRNILMSNWLAILLTFIITFLQVVLMVGELGKILLIFGYTFQIALYSVCYIFVMSVFFYRIFGKLFPARKIIVVYEKKSPDFIINKMSKRKDRFIYSGKVDLSEGIENVKAKIFDNEAVLFHGINPEDRNNLLKYTFSNEVSTYYTTQISDIFIRTSEDTSLFDTPIMRVRNPELTIIEKIIKRIFDIILSILLLLFFLPICFIVSFSIKKNDKGPIFYKQKRITKNGKCFELIKFRSMKIDAEADGVAKLSTLNDERITSVGKFIRKKRIDEIPQLINVIKGDMSLVGPRPERPELIEEYKKEFPEFNYRLRYKAGLTGYAQVYGKYNTGVYDKLKLDLNYIMNYSILLDMKIIIATIKVIFMKSSTEGISSEDKS